MQNVNNNNLNIGLIAKKRADSSLEKKAWGNIAVNWEIIYVAIPGKHFTHLQLGPYVFGQWHIFFFMLLSRYTITVYFKENNMWLKCRV